MGLAAGRWSDPQSPGGAAMGPSPARAPPQEGNREQSTARYQRCPKTSPSSSCGQPAALTPNSLPAFLVGKAGKGPNRWTLEAGGGKAARPSLVGAERAGIGFVFFFPLRLQHKNKALIGIATRRGQLCPVPVGHIPWGAAAASPRPSGEGGAAATEGAGSGHRSRQQIPASGGVRAPRPFWAASLSSHTVPRHQRIPPASPTPTSGSGMEEPRAHLRCGRGERSTSRTPGAGRNAPARRKHSPRHDAAPPLGASPSSSGAAPNPERNGAGGRAAPPPDLHVPSSPAAVVTQKSPPGVLRLHPAQGPAAAGTAPSTHPTPVHPPPSRTLSRRLSAARPGPQSRPAPDPAPARTCARSAGPGTRSQQSQRPHPAPRMLPGDEPAPRARRSHPTLGHAAPHLRTQQPQIRHPTPAPRRQRAPIPSPRRLPEARLGSVRFRAARRRLSCPPQVAMRGPAVGRAAPRRPHYGAPCRPSCAPRSAPAL